MRIRKVWLLTAFLFILTGTILNSEESDERAQKEAERKARLEMTATVEELAAAKKEEIAHLFQKGVEHYRKSEFESAITRFEKILEIAPENEIARAYLERTQKYIEHREKQELRRRQAEERKLLAEKRKREKKDAQIQAQKERLAKVHIGRGDAYYRSRRLEPAISEWKKALSIYPESPEAQDRLLRVERELAEKYERIDNEGEAEKLIDQGRLYFRQRQYKEAIACWQRILSLVPGNHPDYDRAESWVHVAEIYRLRVEEKEAISRKDISERSLLAGITETWLPRRREAKEVGEAEPAAEGEVPSEEERKIEEKARQIISVNFENAHIRSVLTYLSEVSEVNIVLDEEVFSAVEAEPAEGQTSPRITIDLQDLPLIEALRVILRAKNLVHRMEENLIWITTAERMAAERLVTKIYSLLRAVTGVVEIERPEAREEEEEGEGRRLEEEEEEEAGETVISAETIVATLEAAIPWPKGSFINFDNRTGNLVVRNTQTNLATLEELVRQIEGIPMQVEIEARFVTVSTNELRQLGVEFPYLRVALGAKGDIDIDRDSGYGVNLPYVVGDSSQGEGLALSYTKLNPTQFQILFDAIEKTESVNLLSAPKVTTRNLQTAEIKAVSEYFFADDWETFYYIYYADMDSDGDVEPVQGTTIVPSSFQEEPTEIGIILTVTPDIGADRNITLEVVPIVNEFMGWLTFGTGGGDENYIQLGEIHEKRIRTQVVVGDGETIVMGGLIEEKSGETLSKVPFLGDIPLLGRLFSRTVTTSNKESLLIFITTHLVKPTGERYCP